MKVLIADTFEPSGIEGLKAAGCEVVYEPDLKDDALTEAIRAGFDRHLIKPVDVDELVRVLSEMRRAKAGV